MSGTSLLDARGCLTDQGIAALASAPVGKAPAEVAVHLAGCARCQDRLLSAERASDRAARSPARRWPVRNIVLVGVALLMTLLALALTLSTLSGR